MQEPLILLNEKLMLEESPDVKRLKYVMDFREKLVQVSEIAKKNLKSTQKSMKARYDKRKSVERNFSPARR